MTARYFATDCETTAIKPQEGSLMECAFFILDENFEFLDELHFLLKHDTYHVKASALAVNKIDIVKHHHDKRAISLASAEIKLRAFLYQACQPFTPEGNPTYKLTPFGHVVKFDMGWIEHNFAGGIEEWGDLFEHRHLDTASTAKFLQHPLVGILPVDLKGSLESLAGFFGIQYEAHTARSDIMATIKVFQAMAGLLPKAGRDAILESIESIRTGSVGGL
jgi:hypothetical protein